MSEISPFETTGQLFPQRASVVTPIQE